MEYILGHDLGSSGDKACIFDRNGGFLAEAYYTYDTEMTSDGGAFQKPEDWWEALCRSTKEVIERSGVNPKEIIAMSFGAQGNAVLPMGKNGEVLRDTAIIWMDTRNAEEADILNESLSEDELYAITGNAYERSMRESAKLLHMKRHEKEILDKTYKIAGVREYLICRLTGKLEYTDFCEASGSCMYDIRKRKYSDEILKVIGIDQSILLEPVDCTSVAGTVTAEAASMTGLLEGTPIVMGCWDNFACATGAGVRKKGTYVSYLGTAGWLGVDSEVPIGDNDTKLNIVYAGRGEYHNSAHSHSACLAYEWVLNQLNLPEEEKFAEAARLAEAVPAGSCGVYFMPAMLHGNTFYQDACLNSGFLGLRPEHGMGHLIRAAMEGVGYDLMFGVDNFKKKGAYAKSAAIIGGGAKNAFWVQMLSDMFDVPMIRPKNMQHVGAWGAAMMAGVGVGLYPDFEEISGKLTADAQFLPDQKQHEIYERGLPKVKQIYETMMKLYREIGG